MTLSVTDKHILIQIAEGKTNKMIAASLNLAPGTIKNYIARLMETLQCENRAQLAAYAIRERIADTRFWDAPHPIAGYDEEVLELYNQIATHSHKTAADILEALL